MFRGNILDTLLKTGLSAYSAYKGGAYDDMFSNLTPSTGDTSMIKAAGLPSGDVLQELLPEGTIPGIKQARGLEFGSSGVMGLQPATSGLQDQRFSGTPSPLGSLLQQYTKPSDAFSYADLGIGI